MTRVLCVAGEVSGDQLMAPIVRQLVESGASVRGVGGDESIDAGLEAIAHIDRYCVGGVTEVIGVIPRAMRLLKELRKAARDVDAVLLVDWPEINLRLLKSLPLDRVRSVYVSPPQAWAWRGRRVEQLRPVGLVGCLFPFEAKWYIRGGCRVRYLGHPLAGLEPLEDPIRPGIALLPGSRVPYVKRLLPTQLSAARILQEEVPELNFSFGCAPTVDADWVDAQAKAAGVHLTIHSGAREALKSSGLAWAGVGTVALHAVLLGRPYVAMAKVSALSAAVARALVDVPHYTLPNLILGTGAFPELLQGNCTVDALLGATRNAWAANAHHQRSIDGVRTALTGGDGIGPIVRYLGAGDTDVVNPLDDCAQRV